MEYLNIFTTVAILHFLALISPGPDFIMITRNSLVYSRRTGIYSALGLGLGMLLHVSYSLIGIGLIIAKSIILFSLLKFFGASYLIYIGYKSLSSKKSKSTNITEIKKDELPALKALKVGFLTNATNPKATLFFLSIFTLVVKPSTPAFLKILMGIEMSAVTSIWFILVAAIFTHRVMINRIGRIQKYAEKIMGVLLIAFGIKLALSSTKS